MIPSIAPGSPLQPQRGSEPGAETSLDGVFDCVVVGGGPAGATAANDLARAGHRVLLLDRAGRIKPCGGAIPPRAIADFEIPDHLLVAKARAARMIAPSAKAVDMPVGDGFVGMVDRAPFDEWLRERAAAAGAERRTGSFERIDRDSRGRAVIVYRAARGAAEQRVTARCVIGADGARSGVARAALPGGGVVPCVYAYHEIVAAPPAGADGFDPSRCDVFYQGKHSPDFYAWVFPHGDTASIGVGSAQKGFALRESVAGLRAQIGLDHCATLRCEGAPIPLKPLKRWDNGRDVLVAGDAAGVVAPASGEGIYYAMAGGRHAAEAVTLFLATGKASALRLARKRFMRAHGRVFLILGIMQYFWYASDKRRERFVKICEDPDVQRLTWDAYMNKRLVRSKPVAHVRIFLKDMRHLLGLAPA
ncbi:geranylgeranyl diphosphate reductase [Sphingomonas sp. RB3P16]|uniref:geranylgeranyl diphosphate reductase n=1 Tax=Parasphingomonas frigoris TaxID=3096163 RepID=UPI002FC734FE